MIQFFNPAYDQSYQNWVEKQTEDPNDFIIMGNGKRHKPVKYPEFDWKAYHEKNKKYDTMTEQEDEARQDAYLRSHGL